MSAGRQLLHVNWVAMESTLQHSARHVFLDKHSSKKSAQDTRSSVTDIQKANQGTVVSDLQSDHHY